MGVQARGRLAQQLVTGRVPERVVDVLEVVEVEDEERHGRPVALRPRQGEVEVLGQQRAVGQAGERVVVGQAGDLLLGAPAVGHLGAQRRLGLAQRGDVEQDALAVGGAAGLVADDGVALEDVDRAAVGGAHAELALEGRLAVERRGGGGEDARAVVGVDEALPQPAALGVLAGQEGRGRVAEQRLDLGRDVGQRPDRVERGDVGHDGGVLDEVPPARLGVAQARQRRREGVGRLGCGHGQPGERGMGLVEVPAEGAVDERLGPQAVQHGGQQARRQRRQHPLQAQRTAGTRGAWASWKAA